MRDDELRRIVRDAVARHLGRTGSGSAAGGAADAPAAPPAAVAVAVAAASHPSHALYVSLVNVSDACVIEPSVGCNHCGYCKSHGH